MRRRRDSDESATSHAGTGFGVGVQVVVRLDRSNYPGTLILDPAGVIVAPGETLGAAFFAPLSRREPVWEVQFEEPSSASTARDRTILRVCRKASSRSRPRRRWKRHGFRATPIFAGGDGISPMSRLRARFTGTSHGVAAARNARFSLPLLRLRAAMRRIGVSFSANRSARHGRGHSAPGCSASSPGASVRCSCWPSHSERRRVRRMRLTSMRQMRWQPTNAFTKRLFAVWLLGGDCGCPARFAPRCLASTTAW